MVGKLLYDSDKPILYQSILQVWKGLQQVHFKLLIAHVTVGVKTFREHLLLKLDLIGLKCGYVSPFYPYLQ